MQEYPAFIQSIVKSGHFRARPVERLPDHSGTRTMQGPLQMRAACTQESEMTTAQSTASDAG
jgi:hypothetical protein